MLLWQACCNTSGCCRVLVTCAHACITTLSWPRRGAGLQISLSSIAGGQWQDVTLPELVQQLNACAAMLAAEKGALCRPARGGHALCFGGRCEMAVDAHGGVLLSDVHTPTPTLAFRPPLQTPCSIGVLGSH